MEEQTRQQVQGAVELARDAVQAGARSIGAAHEEIADIPYRVLRRIPVVARPAGAIGRVQQGITRFVYAAVGATSGLATAVATCLLQAAAAERSETS